MSWYAENALSCVKDVIVKLELCQIWFCSASWVLWASVHQPGGSWTELGCWFYKSETKGLYAGDHPNFMASMDFPDLNSWVIL